MTFRRHKTATDKITIYILSVFFIHLIGGGYLYYKNLEKRLVVYKDSPIEATIELSSPKIEVTTDETNEQSIHKTLLTATVANHSVDRFTTVLLILPSIGTNTLETPTTKRVTNLPQQGNDDVFSLGNISPGKSKKGTVWIYSTKNKTYTIKAYIETKEKFSKTTNAVVLEVK